MNDLKDVVPQPSDLVPLLPGAITVIILLVAGILVARRSRIMGLSLAGLAWPIGHLVTYVRIVNWPPFPPVQSSQRMAYAVVAMAFVGILCEVIRRRRTPALLLRVGVAAAMVTWLVQPFLDPDHTYHVAVSTRLWLTGGITAFWILVEGLLRQHKGPVVPLALAIVLGGTGQMLLISGGIVWAQLLGTASIALGVSALISLRLKDAVAPVAAASLTGIFAACVLDSHFFADPTPPGWPFIMVAASPLLLWIGRIPPLRSLKPWVRGVVQIVLVAAVVGIGVWQARNAVPEDEAVDPLEEMYREMNK